MSWRRGRFLFLAGVSGVLVATVIFEFCAKSMPAETALLVAFGLAACLGISAYFAGRLERSVVEAQEISSVYIPPFYLREAELHYPDRYCEYAARFGFFDGELDILSDGMSALPTEELATRKIPRCGHETFHQDCIACRRENREPLA